MPTIDKFGVPRMDAELQKKVLDKFTLDEIILEAIIHGIEECHGWGIDGAKGVNICNSRSIAEALCEQMLKEGKTIQNLAEIKANKQSSIN